MMRTPKSALIRNILLGLLTPVCIPIAIRINTIVIEQEYILRVAMADNHA